MKASLAVSSGVSILTDIFFNSNKTPMNQEKALERSGLPTLRVSETSAWILLNRPQRHNRFEPADIEALSAMLRELAGRKGLRVLILTASGPSFSSGFDLDTLSSERAVECSAAFAAMCDLLEALPIPTVCGLNGNVYGGATDLALACDFRIGVEGCRLQMSPARLGIQYYYSGLRRYVERLGLPEAKRLFLMGDQIDTATMLRIGFLTETCAPERFEARLEVVAGMLAQRSPASLRGLKASLNSICRRTADPAEINARFFESLSCADAQEGLKAWSERRLPDFAAE
ncbi:enoyl-CoA hydratase/isomerase family protein [Bradyrhizobium sp. CSS354]|uniref:enoyl-CoA hydratase/isomerase family protein n=1 Tax=Bradyrhizobium sp. CSS354 TaxID=2699172 RepID=UPI0023AF87D6|nr:enoyl-CoA hydratase/isomerase family protein [Bradyrhizobium sp. CSS354]MDE5466343.1 enoyl-CoA hydratase/isomerase family protein [Bradyrhizobium sp. CSS354]